MFYIIIEKNEVQEHAQASMAQGAHSLERIAAAGAHGAHPQNVHRALVHAFGWPRGAPQFSWFPVSMVGGTQMLPFLLPHTWFGTLFRERPAVWSAAIIGPHGTPGISNF